MLTEKQFKNIMGLAVLGLIVGAWGLGARLLYGHKYMDYGSYVPWGLWVSFDLFFLGLTAGAYVVAIMTYGFRIRLFAALGHADVRVHPLCGRQPLRGQLRSALKRPQVDRGHDQQWDEDRRG